MTRKEIEKASVEYQMATHPMAIGGSALSDMVYKMNINPSFVAGAEWVLGSLWKTADGEDLPDVDKSVIVLKGIVDQTAPDCLCGYEVLFAHRPNPEGYEGSHYLPGLYGKGGWNIPDVVMWLDLDIPELEEDMV